MSVAKILVSMCSILPLAVSSLPFLISLIPLSKDIYLTSISTRPSLFQFPCADLFLSRHSKSGTSSSSILMFDLIVGAGLCYAFTIFPFVKMTKKWIQNEAGQLQWPLLSQSNTNALDFVISPGEHRPFFMCHQTFISAGREHFPLC